MNRICHCEHSEAIQLQHKVRLLRCVPSLQASARFLAMTLMTTLLASGLTGCGNKGKVKSPSQIQLEEAKKARKKAKEEKLPPPPPGVAPAFNAKDAGNDESAPQPDDEPQEAK